MNMKQIGREGKKMQRRGRGGRESGKQYLKGSGDGCTGVHLTTGAQKHGGFSLEMLRPTQD